MREVVQRNPRAVQLVGVAASLGYSLLYGEADRLIKQFKSYFRAVAWVRQRVQAERQLVQDQIRAGEIAASGAASGSDMTGTKRARTTDLQRPVANALVGRELTIGSCPTYTTSSKRCVVSRGRKKTKLAHIVGNLSRSVLWRWQSLNPHDYQNWQYNGQRSLHLDTPTLYETSGNNKLPLLMGLPMYAFDLTTIPAQSIASVATKTGFRFESCPMYRLYKVLVNFGTPGSINYSLHPDVHNYTWRPVNGSNNGPGTKYHDTNDPLWHQEYTEAIPHYYSAVQTNYTAVDLLFKCKDTVPCQMHTSIVEFKNGSGPDRLFCDNQLWDAQGTGNGKMVTTSYDVETQNQVNDSVTKRRDAFWESFWDSKLVHPLCDYRTDWNDWIRFLKDDIINVRPSSTGSNEPDYVHKMSYMCSDGGIQDLHDPVVGDSVDVDKRCPPIYPDLSEAYGAFDNPGGYNVTDRTEAREVLYHATESSRDSNKWLLVWMDGLLPHYGSNIEVLKTPDTNFEQWFWQLRGNAVSNAFCCSFDVRARKRTEYLRGSSGV